MTRELPQAGIYRKIINFVSSGKKKFEELELGFSDDDLSQKSQENDVSKAIKSQKIITRFNVLRRCLRALKLSKKFALPVVLTSTYSKLTNFMPHKFYDPSRREILLNDSDLPTEQHLHRVFILQEPMDIHMRRKFVDIRDFASYLKSLNYLKNLFTHGRPQWGSIISSLEKKGGSLPECLREIVHSAELKLAISIEMTALDAIALLGHTVGLDKFTSSNWASNVVKSKLGFLESVDTYVGTLVSSFHSEPVVAVAACNILCQTRVGLPRLVEVLEGYRKVTEAGHLDIGDCGEFVSRLIFFMAKIFATPVEVDYQYEENFHSSFPVTLRSFLSTLEPDFQAEIDPEFLDGMLSFNHFIHLESFEIPNNNMKALLYQAFCRGSAIWLQEGCIGCDFIIPFLTKSGKLTWLLTQVKSCRKHEDFEYAVTLRGMIEFARIYSIEVEPFYILFNLTADSCKNPIKNFHSQTINAVKRSNGFAPQGIIIEGARFVFPTLSRIAVDHLNSTICDLVNCYRGANLRNTPNYAGFSTDDFLRFPSHL
jgi:hypothetical protein